MIHSAACSASSSNFFLVWTSSPWSKRLAPRGMRAALAAGVSLSPCCFVNWVALTRYGRSIMAFPTLRGEALAFGH